MESRATVATRVKSWTRERFGDVTVLVTELESSVPGFPPLHTVVAFWTPERRHYHFKVFKPLEKVEEADLPPAVAAIVAPVRRLAGFGPDLPALARTGIATVATDHQPLQQVAGAGLAGPRAAGLQARRYGPARGLGARAQRMPSLRRDRARGRS